jgi:alpha-mannosidase
VRKGYEFNNPLIALATDVHKGDLPIQHSFVQISPSNLVLTSVKRSEDGEAWVVQWYDTEGKVSDATISFPRTPKKVVLSNFLEEVGSSVPVRNNAVNVRTRASSIVTLRVSF